MKASDHESRIREWAAARKLPAAQLERWIALREADRAAILFVAEKLRPHTGQFTAMVDLLEEIQVRESCEIATILTRGEVRNVIDGAGSSPGKARALLDLLRGIRFPQLRAESNRLAARITELKLPAGIRVVLPPNLGSDELRVELIVHGGAELEQVLIALTAHRAELCAIAESLGGADDV